MLYPDGSGIVTIVLIVVVLIAIVEVLFPSVVGIVLSRRPIVVRGEVMSYTHTTIDRMLSKFTGFHPFVTSNGYDRDNKDTRILP